MIRKLILFLLIALMVAFACLNERQMNRMPKIPGPQTEAIELGKYENVFYVSQTVGSDETGSGTEAAPWQTIRFALQKLAGKRTQKPTAILVAEGKYAEGTLKMQPGVDLYGGFGGDEWQRNIFEYQTYLLGENEYRVLVGVDSARLDGFVIYRGAVRGRGGGLLCDGVSPQITNNIFMRNRTLQPDLWQPTYLHELGNDGGAICCLNGAAPIISHNLFWENSTETGRGAAIACHKNVRAKIENNVFLENTSGTTDPLRSSDGGAISIFDHSPTVVKNNVLIRNRALGSNDAGGIFVAFWSSAIVDSNVLVANYGDDDGGALFVGGQEHRYDRPLDPLPDAKEFFVQVRDNLFIANENKSRNSGVVRFTMEARGNFSRNVMAHNSGVYFQRCEATIRENIILDNFLLVETKQGLKKSIIQRNTIWGNFDLGVEADVADNLILNEPKGKSAKNIPVIREDWLRLTCESAIFDAGRAVTVCRILSRNLTPNQLINRVVKANGRWGVVCRNGQHTIEVWGDFSGAAELMILPTYQLK